MTIKRIAGIDDMSNMITGVEYEGKLLESVQKGKRVWLVRNEVLFNTGYVTRLKETIFRTSNAVYEINY